MDKNSNNARAGWVFLSYHGKDRALAKAVADAMRAGPVPDVYFAPEELRAGGFWLPMLAEAIREASAFVLLVGENGLGPYQIQEYYAAFDRRTKEPSFHLVVLLLKGKGAPGLPFIEHLHWTISDDPAGHEALAHVAQGLAGDARRPKELWRHATPYRGLLAMTEAESAFFFGRVAETRQVLNLMAAVPGGMPLLIGNSGVGKSSVASAGVIASLKREAMPDATSWPVALSGSRSWAFLTMRPGTAPLPALVEPFLRLWQLDPTDNDSARKRKGWIEDLGTGSLALGDLLDATIHRLESLGEGVPAGFLLSIDQGEELYVRAPEVEQSRFSALVAAALSDQRFRAMMSLRADFLGALQGDEALFAVRRQVDVAPLREEALREVIARPAAMLGARFERTGLPDELACRAAEDSTKDAGALPLLSYLLDDMWTGMIGRDDGELRLPAAVVELGRVLVSRAHEYLTRYPEHTEPLRRILTLKLATVREDGEPTRRRAARSEFTESEWQIISALADHPYRLLVTSSPERSGAFDPTLPHREVDVDVLRDASDHHGSVGKMAGLGPTDAVGQATTPPAYAEVAHEAIFRHWVTLKGWIAAQRDFLIWKGGLEADCRRWHTMPEESSHEALLQGHRLAEAAMHLSNRFYDLGRLEQDYITASLSLKESRDVARAERLTQKLKDQRARTRRAVAGTVIALMLAVFALINWRKADRQGYAAEQANRQSAATLNAATTTVEIIVVKLAEELRDRGLPLDQVQEVLDRSSSLLDDLVRTSPLSPNLLRLQLIVQQNFAETYLSAKVTDKALEAADQAVSIGKKLINIEPESAMYARYMGKSLISLGNVLSERGDNRAAFNAYNESLPYFERLLEQGPAGPNLLADAADSLVNVGDAIRWRNDYQEAMIYYRRALAIIELPSKSDPKNRRLAIELTYVLDRIGDILSATGDAQGAHENRERSLGIVQTLLNEAPNDLQLKEHEAEYILKLGDEARAKSDLGLALRRYEEVLKIYERLVSFDQYNAKFLRLVSVGLNRIGKTFRRKKEFASALVFFGRDLTIVRRLADRDPGNANAARELAVTLNDLALTYWSLDKDDEACARVRDGAALLSRFGNRSNMRAEFRDTVSVFEGEMEICHL